jgi:hypothetical protein
VNVGSSTGIINVTGDWNNSGLGIRLELDNLAASTVDGVEFDQLNVTGQFTQGGAVTIDRSELVLPAATRQLKIIGWGSQSGLSSSTIVSFVGGSPLAYSFQSDGLYLTVGPSGIAGDYNNNGIVDAADYVVWRKNAGTNNPLPNNPIPGTIGQQQYDQWRANFGKPITGGTGLVSPASLTVPEPAASTFWIALTVLGLAQRRRAGGKI